MDEILEEIFNRWGTYKSLQKDVEIIKYFLNKPEQSIRQKTIINHFEGKMSPKTVREHLKRLKQKRIIEEDPVYRGTYVFFPHYYRKMGIDMDRLVRAVVGEDIYVLAVSIWKDKHQQREESRDIPSDPFEARIEKEIKEVERELDEYIMDHL